MAIKINGTESRYTILHNGKKLKKGYHNGETEIWSAGSVVTYIFNRETFMEEEVDYGESVLRTMYTPNMEGGTFVGWTTDINGNEPLTELLADGKPITLYSIFRVKIINDSILYKSMATSSNCSKLTSYNKAFTCFGVYLRRSGDEGSITVNGSLTLDDMFIGKKIYWKALYSVFNAIHGTNKGCYGRISNDGEYLFDETDPSYTNGLDFGYFGEGEFVLNDKTFAIESNLSREADDDQATQFFDSIVGFTNMYAVGVF